MTFYIFRHGITYVSKHGLTYGDTEETAEILPEAYPSIQKIGKFLKDKKTEANFTSPYKRCLQTQDIVKKYSGKEFIPDTRIGENRPDLEETNEEFFSRIRDFLKDIESKKYVSVAICSHGYPIAALIQQITTGTIVEEKLNPYPDTGVLTIIKDSIVETLDFN